MAEKKEGNTSISTIIIATIAIIIIIALAFFYYYFTTKLYPIESPPPVVVKNLPVKNKPAALAVLPKKESFTTEVINFVPPENLPAEIKEGDCQTNSFADPYRRDAWRCAAGKVVYDPCFSIALSDVVYCKMNPLQDGGEFLIKLAKPLPEPIVPENAQDNWAWFIELRDGTYCSPYTGPRPIVNSQVAFYGCKSNAAGEQAVLMGDLKKNLIWKAEKATLIKSGLKWVLKFSEELEIKTVWQ